MLCTSWWLSPFMHFSTDINQSGHRKWKVTSCGVWNECLYDKHAIKVALMCPQQTRYKPHTTSILNDLCVMVKFRVWSWHHKQIQWFPFRKLFSFFWSLDVSNVVECGNPAPHMSKSRPDQAHGTFSCGPGDVWIFCHTYHTGYWQATSWVLTI